MYYVFNVLVRYKSIDWICHNHRLIGCCRGNEEGEWYTHVLIGSSPKDHYLDKRYEWAKIE